MISLLLLAHSINANNPFVQNLCSLGNKNNCNAILKSPQAKVTDWLNWSEVGFFYYAGSFLALLLNPTSIHLLAWMNIFCLLFTFWSISYQYKTKNWCVLCCGIQVLLWVEFLGFITTPNAYKFVFENSSLLFTAILFMIPVVVWANIKPILWKAEQVKPLAQQLKKFKYNSNLFTQLLTNQARFSVTDDLMPITLGNPEASTIITMVSNLFCGPCAKAHQTIEQWLKNRDDLQLKIIFTTANHDDDKRTKVARHLSALSLSEDAEKIETALNDWYNQSEIKYDTWAEKYPVTIPIDTQKITERQKEWCELTEITETPTILINGYKLPEPYQLDDIKYLLP